MVCPKSCVINISNSVNICKGMQEPGFPHDENQPIDWVMLTRMRMDAFNFMENQSMFGSLDPEEIDALLHRQIIGRIGCHADGVTYIVPISYVYDGKYIYAHSLEGMKIGLMRHNTNVCFEVDFLDQTENWQSVVCWGSFEELVNLNEREEALKKLHSDALPKAVSLTAKLSPSWPLLPRDVNSVDGVVFRIKLYKKTGKFQKSSVVADKS